MRFIAHIRAKLDCDDASYRHRRVDGNRSPSKRMANASASSGLVKQNTTNSPSSRSREYGRGAADRDSAKLQTISLFLTPRTLSADNPLRYRVALQRNVGAALRTERRRCRHSRVMISSQRPPLS